MKNENQIPNKRLLGNAPPFLPLDKPSISPQVAKMVVESEVRHNEHKFQYLSQIQSDDAEANKRTDALKELEHNFKRDKHTNHYTLLKLIVGTALVMIVGSAVAGIWLCWIGKEAIGGPILGAVLSFLAGLGTSNFLKNNA